jgi:hypothetical protein
MFTGEFLNHLLPAEWKICDGADMYDESVSFTSVQDRQKGLMHLRVYSCYMRRVAKFVAVTREHALLHASDCAICSGNFPRLLDSVTKCGGGVMNTGWLSHKKQSIACTRLWRLT